jgi:HSF-type DNA-binding
MDNQENCHKERDLQQGQETAVSMGGQPAFNSSDESMDSDSDHQDMQREQHKSQSHDVTSDQSISLYSNPALSRKVRGGTPSFPTKLHEVLQLAKIEGFESVVSWCDVGISVSRSFIEECRISGSTPFKVHDPEKFLGNIVPRFFPMMGKFKSFLRQLNLWGFSRVRSKDPLNGSYYRPLFARDRAELCPSIKRTKTKGLYVRGSSRGVQGIFAAGQVTPKNPDVFDEFATFEGEGYHSALREEPETKIARYSNDEVASAKATTVPLLRAIPNVHLAPYALEAPPSFSRPSIDTGYRMKGTGTSHPSLPVPKSFPLLGESRMTNMASYQHFPPLPVRDPLPILDSARTSNVDTSQISSSVQSLQQLTSEGGLPRHSIGTGAGSNLTRGDVGSFSENERRYVEIGIHIGQRYFDNNADPDGQGVLNHLMRINEEGDRRKGGNKDET